MDYVTAGAKDREGERFPSKKALKEALTADPSEVIFDITDLFHSELGKLICADSIPADVTVQVAGPDPYTSRKWFASIITGPKLS